MLNRDHFVEQQKDKLSTTSSHNYTQNVTTNLALSIKPHSLEIIFFAFSFIFSPPYRAIHQMSIHLVYPTIHPYHCLYHLIEAKMMVIFRVTELRFMMTPGNRWIHAVQPKDGGRLVTIILPVMVFITPQD